MSDIECAQASRAKQSNTCNKEHWAAVWSLALGSFASVTTEFLPVGVLPEVAHTFNISDGQAGLMMTSPALFAAVAAPGVMMAAGRIDRRRVLIGLCVMLLAACLLAAFANSFALLLVSRAMVGASLGAFWSLGLAVAGRLVAPEHVHHAAGTIFGGAALAMIVGLPFGTLLAGFFSWRGAFIGAGVLASVALIAQIVVLPPMPAQSRLRLAGFADFARQREAQLSLALTLLVFITHFGAYTYLMPLLLQAGISGDTGTGVLLAYGFCALVANFAAGRYVGRKLGAAMLGNILLLAVTLAVLPSLDHARLTVLAGVMIWGIAWGALPLCLNVWHRRVPGGESEAAAALFTLATQVAIALGSVVGGVVVDHRSLAADYRYCALLGCVAAALAFRAGSRARSRELQIEKEHV
ncbi:putative MFS family arabinose efflux permease [Paraburkholderia bannensis]|uniref:Putative MFS family arabinose efflux permease n=1 Tax=Paraburkholderia bannensis TaxID=765414 RepID=A0A7W9U427_9BURK|nr:MULTISPECIES: MFS transporter [Paraburkholderia]MBB3260721.1 putative MFS family arabinose efflux permease [Paraburkholderia sp. WP4_3_2]MBB6105891.1 putative MFS family arabinose efflux permease [Paraburkholderia bannensis]